MRQRRDEEREDYPKVSGFKEGVSSKLGKGKVGGDRFVSDGRNPKVS